MGTEDPAYTGGWTSFVDEYALLHEVMIITLMITNKDNNCY